MHCGRCCLRLEKNKDGTVPKHYDEWTKGLSWEQGECRGSGGRDFLEEGRVRRCRRQKSQMRCPKCGRKAGAKDNGKVRMHKDGGETCAAAAANK